MSIRPHYLRVEPDPVLAFHHAPDEAHGTAVLMCPPFGWEDVCAYRSVREWAIELAAAGHHALRLELPGCGDSAGSPWDPDRLGTWTAALAGGAARLRAEPGVQRVCAIGIGLGGLLALRAAAGGAAIDDFVLWAVPARGRTMLRELRAFAKLEESKWSQPGAPEPPPTPDGAFEVAGFVLSAETMAALEAVDATALELPHAGARRALLLDRDGLPPDRRLREHLEGAGVAVTTGDGSGFGAMMAGAQESTPPRAVFARVAEWLAAPAPASPLAPGDPPIAEDVLELDGVRETPLELDLPSGRLFGILAEPPGAAGGLTAVLLNAGAIRRLGPNRMWTEAARRWAARGVATLRLDLEGIGDAGGPADRYTELAQLYVPELTDQVSDTLNALAERGLPARFVLGGLCSGAYWSFHATLREPRVAAAFLLNPRALFWDPELEVRRAQRRLGAVAARPSAWRRFLKHPERRSLLRYASRAALSRPRRRSTSALHGHEGLESALDRLRDEGRSVLLAFSGNEPLHDEMRADGLLAQPLRWPNLRLAELPGHIHTLRTVATQRRTHALLDEALEAELARVGSEPAPAR